MQSLVEKRRNEFKISRVDRVNTFLMYDMDVQTINDKLLKYKVEMFLSNYFNI